MNKFHIKGMLMVIVATSFWGLSGTAAQYLFEQQQAEAGWLASVRLLLSGIILLIYVSLTQGVKKAFHIWLVKEQAFRLILFSIFGSLGVQYTFFASIEEGNAAVATILQNLAPFFILMYLYFKKAVSPNLVDLFLVFFMLSGVFLLLTNGALDGLSVSTNAIIWGVLSGCAVAFYTIYPSHLIQEQGSLIVVGWSMLIGGIGISFVFSPLSINIGQFDIIGWGLIIFIVIFGTLISFTLYIVSLSYLSPKDASLLGCSEPMIAVLSSVGFLHIPFGIFQGLGSVIIIITVIFLSMQNEERVHRKSL
ncbi:EamA family transporter [Bacillus sp. WMMC1349]|uniref:DMT family transporter n=1 Tax=Bacillus sp. WMMC1349 TaxID=2736254 RepID=UPI0015537166|nr:DMT family transporter [Bacillus sp. WMMC1349]NPC94146.1 EamA family transporter [Bacillus sp. WMMC1349]